MPTLSAKPPDLDENGNPIVPGVTDVGKKSASKPPDLDENGNEIKPGILDKASQFLKEHPKIRELGERFLTGTSPEYEETLRKLSLESLEHPLFGKPSESNVNEINRLKSGGKVNIVGPPEAEKSLLPDWKSQPETYWGGFLKSLYQDVLKPQTTPSGIIGFASPGAGGPKRFGRPEVTDLGNVPPVRPELKRLTSGPSFYTTPEGETISTASIPALRDVTRFSKELPYRYQGQLPRIDMGTALETPHRFGEPYPPRELPIQEGELVKPPIDPRDAGVRFSTKEEADLARPAEELPIRQPSEPISEVRPPKVEKAKFVNPFEKKTEKPPDLDEAGNEIEGPQFARSEQGGIKIGQNIRRSAQELTTGYSSPLESIMVREGMQNAIDAVRHLGEDGKIRVELGPISVDNPDQNFIHISDNGRGMNRQELETVFSDLHESGKTTEAGATGGKGVGKATYMLGGSSFKAETVVLENGKKVKRIIEGTPEDFATHVPIQEEIVPLNTPTGTTIQTTLKEGQEGYNTRGMVNDIMNNTRGVKAKVIMNRYGYDEPAVSFQSGANDKAIGNARLNNNDVSVRVPKDAELSPRTYIKVSYLNNGMHQFDKTHYLPEEIPNMPDKLLVDIHPSMEEGTPEYPFPVQRESIKQSLQGKIDNLINDKLAFPERAARKSRLQELYDSLPQVAIGTTIRKAVLFDPGNRLTSSELSTIKKSPIINNFVTIIDNVIDNALKSAGNEKWIERLEGVGVVLDRDMHGVHIPNPSTGKSTILINPFEYAALGQSPEEAALSSVITAEHEVAHIGSETEVGSPAVTADELRDPRIGQYLQSYLTQVVEHGGSDMGHGMAFVKRLGEVYAKFGPGKALAAADKIQSIISDEVGGYNPEFQELLQIYKESRRREATTEDLLSGTGAKQAARSRGEGNVPSGDKSNGERISPISSAINKIFSALEESKGLLEEQAAINKAERARRFAAFESVKTEGLAGAKKSMSKLRGEYEKVSGEALQLSEEETNSLFSAVKQANITTPEKARAYTSLFKLLDGEVPQRNELKILDDIYGNGFAEKIIEMHGGIGVMALKIGKTANTMKAMMSSFDLSAPMKQGIGLIHRPEWRAAAIDMIKFFHNKEFFENSMKAIENDPIYLLSRDGGLFIAKTDNLLHGEEAFLNNYISDLPMGIRGLYIRGQMEASERAYVGFLNKLRFDTFKSLAALAKEGGNELSTIVEHEAADGTITRSETPNKIVKDLARYINVSTGRGGLGKLEKIAPELNTFLWSPRLISSRLTILTNPKYYIDADPFVRKEAIKTAFAIAGASTILNTLGWIGGATVGYNILSSDFAKSRFGRNVMDPGGGFQQPVVLAARIVSELNRMHQGIKPKYGEKSIPELIGNFAINKLSPAAGLGYDIASARRFTGSGNYEDRFGNKKSIPIEVAKRFTPIFTQDVYDTLFNDTDLATAIGLDAASLVGIGVQDYPERTPNQGTNKSRMRSLRLR